MDEQITIYINGEHIGDGTEEDAQWIADWLTRNTGWRVKYGNDNGAGYKWLEEHGMADAFDVDFGRALDAWCDSFLEAA